MPDWSYHNIFKPILSTLPDYVSREWIHKSINMIASMPLGKQLIQFLGHFDVNDSAKTNIENVCFPNRVGLSGKLDPLLSGTNGFTNMGFGFIEIGPVSIKDNDIHKVPRANFYTKEMTFPSEKISLGYEKVIQRLKLITKQQPFMIRLTGSKKEIHDLASSLEPFGDVFVIESIPNDDIDFILSLKKIVNDKPIFLSISSRISSNELHNLLWIQDYVSGIVIDEDHNLSNRENLRLMIDVLAWFKKNFPSSFYLVTSGGIKEPEDAIRLFNTGAQFVMVSGGYVFSGPGLPKRINESFQYEEDCEKDEAFGWRSYWLFGLSIFIGGLIAFIFSMTTIILPYDEAFLQITRNDILSYNENILYFMSHDRMTLAGTMISSGIVYMQLAKHGVKQGLHWAKKVIDAAAITGFLGFLLFIGYGYFDWLHLLFYLILVPFYLNGYIKTKKIKKAPTSLDLCNDWKWRQSLIGQLSFIILGASFIVGGIVISSIGVSTVFVPTDIEYICMPKEMIQQFNERLIPVIAHDRAGFGTALISVGLLVLLLSLWGFRRGDRWVWWTLMIGGIPAFLTGFWAHIMIGYINFFHLLPAYIALTLYVVGVFTTYPFLKNHSSTIGKGKRFPVVQKH